jgi:hypothetical protein
MLRRIGHALVCGGLLVSGAATAAPKKKIEAPKAPSEITLENGCASPLELSLGGLPLKVEANATSGPHLLPADAPEGVYELTTKAEKPAGLARLGIPPASKYAIRLADCRAGAADVYTRLESFRSPDPHAASRVRFRARQNLALEYKLGPTGRFLPLSIAITRAQELPAGEGEFTFRLRAAKNGPVMKTVTKKLKFEPGHQYLIEANVLDHDVLFSAEDEGPVRASE